MKSQKKQRFPYLTVDTETEKPVAESGNTTAVNTSQSEYPPTPLDMPSVPVFSDIYEKSTLKHPIKKRTKRKSEDEEITGKPHLTHSRRSLEVCRVWSGRT
jgi:hypothetical protein